MKVANLIVVCFKRCSLMKQILYVGQFITIKAHAFYLGLLKTKTHKTNAWRGPSQSKQIAPFEMGTSIGRSVI
jgi:hypothetical protein